MSGNGRLPLLRWSHGRLAGSVGRCILVWTCRRAKKGLLLHFGKHTVHLAGEGLHIALDDTMKTDIALLEEAGCPVESAAYSHWKWDSLEDGRTE